MGILHSQVRQQVKKSKMDVGKSDAWTGKAPAIAYYVDNACRDVAMQRLYTPENLSNNLN